MATAAISADEATAAQLLNAAPDHTELRPREYLRPDHVAPPSKQHESVADAQETYGESDWQPQRRLGVCKGEEHARILEEMLKGANVVIAGDSGKLHMMLRLFS